MSFSGVGVSVVSGVPLRTSGIALFDYFPSGSLHVGIGEDEYYKLLSKYAMVF